MRSFLESSFSATSVKQTDAMKIKFDYRDINNQYQVVPLKITYESDNGAQPAPLNDEPEDDFVRNAFVTCSGGGQVGYMTVEDDWADLMSHHTVEVDEYGNPAFYVNEQIEE